MAGRVACGERGCSFTFTAPHSGFGRPISQIRSLFKVAEKMKMIKQSET